MQKQIHIFFTGKVQGVGFRFAVENIARELSVTGWVMNLSDGRVELRAEAGEEALKEFLSRINQDFSRYIDDADIHWLEAAGRFKEFRIKF